jgi:hypothetical protein
VSLSAADLAALVRGEPVKLHVEGDDRGVIAAPAG